MLTALTVALLAQAPSCELPPRKSVVTASQPIRMSDGTVVGWVSPAVCAGDIYSLTASATFDASGAASAHYQSGGYTVFSNQVSVFAGAGLPYDRSFVTGPKTPLTLTAVHSDRVLAIPSSRDDLHPEAPWTARPLQCSDLALMPPVTVTEEPVGQLVDRHFHARGDLQPGTPILDGPRGQALFRSGDPAHAQKLELRDGQARVRVTFRDGASLSGWVDEAAANEDVGPFDRSIILCSRADFSDLAVACDARLDLYAKSGEKSSVAPLDRLERIGTIDAQTPIVRIAEDHGWTMVFPAGDTPFHFDAWTPWVRTSQLTGCRKPD
jgi:hypothetical protein